MLQSLLAAVDRCAVACARLDATRTLAEHALRRGGRPTAVQEADYAAFDARLAVLTARVDLEVDRLTAERLRVELARKIRQAAA
jgi:hypothetical protein